MSTWDDLVSVALLGTDQQKVPTLGTGSSIGTLLSKLEAATTSGNSKESIVLSAAGALSLYNRAGKMPEPMPSAPLSIAEAEQWQECKPIPASHVQLLVNEYRSTLLPLWLDAAVRAERRIPSSTIPMFLEVAKNERELRPAISKVVGNRGRWLASMNPDWSFASVREIAGAALDDLKNLFETGSPEERATAIRKLREISPEAGRLMLAGTWKEDAHQHKVMFLKSFEIGLSMDDEPFLEETALNDKRKEVRTIAQELLARTSGSRFSQRMNERAKQYLRVKGILTKELDVSYPTECDKEMIRDGIEKPGATVSTSDRQSWLYQILCCVAPSLWETEFKMTPEQILNLKMDTVHERFVVSGWRQAALLHRDEKWAAAFFSHAKFGAHNSAELIATASPDARERMLLRMVEQNKGLIYVAGNEWQQPIMCALEVCTHEWSEAFARKLIPALVEEARDGVNHYGKMLFQRIGFFFPIALSAEMEKSFVTIEPETVTYVDKFLATLKFKSELFEALK